jgi:N-formylglutamate amidohydrolase
VSRLVVDPERFTDDATEPMAAHGLGAVYTRTLTGVPLRNGLSPAEREALLETYYRPHHSRLAARVNEALAAHGAALILDCHSYPAEPHPYEDPRRPRPEVCLGTDPYHTPDWLFETAAEHFRDAGYTLERNHPFSGTIVPLEHLGVNDRVWSIMVELRRNTYMDEKSGSKLVRFDEVRGAVQTALAALIHDAFRASSTRHPA